MVCEMHAIPQMLCRARPTPQAAQQQSSVWWRTCGARAGQKQLPTHKILRCCAIWSHPLTVAPMAHQLHSDSATSDTCPTQSRVSVSIPKQAATMSQRPQTAAAQAPKRAPRRRDRRPCTSRRVLSELTLGSENPGRGGVRRTRCSGRRCACSGRRGCHCSGWS